MDEHEFSAAIAEFEAARVHGEYFPKAWFDRLALDDAYRIQLALIDCRGARRVGCLLADGKLDSGHVFRRDELIEPGFENELCIVMGRDLAPDAAREDVAAAIARVHPAFEIIETRGDLTRQLALALADNAQQKAFVLGPAIGGDALPELDAVTVSVRINGAEVATADGGAVLGHPYNSVAWLAGKLAHFGEKVRAGDYIMSGSFTRQFPLARGDRIEADFAGIGTVAASVD
jgi:2-keto-4-pentenoate hydratase